MNVSISKQLLSLVKSARQRYRCDLNGAQKLDQTDDNETQSLNEKIDLINGQIQSKNGLVVAEGCIIEGNQNF